MTKEKELKTEDEVRKEFKASEKDLQVTLKGKNDFKWRAVQVVWITLLLIITLHQINPKF